MAAPKKTLISRHHKGVKVHAVTQAHTSWTREHARHVHRVEQHWRWAATANWHASPTLVTRVRLAGTLSCAQLQAIQVQALLQLLFPKQSTIIHFI
jgi:hypothetical protein